MKDKQVACLLEKGKALGPRAMKIQSRGAHAPRGIKAYTMFDAAKGFVIACQILHCVPSFLPRATKGAKKQHVK